MKPNDSAWHSVLHLGTPSSQPMSTAMGSDSSMVSGAWAACLTSRFWSITSNKDDTRIANLCQKIETFALHSFGCTIVTPFAKFYETAWDRYTTQESRFGDWHGAWRPFAFGNLCIQFSRCGEMYISVPIWPTNRTAILAPTTHGILEWRITGEKECVFMYNFIYSMHIYLYIFLLQNANVYAIIFIYIYIIGDQYRRVAYIAGITTKAFDAALSVLFQVESLLKKSLLEGVTTRHAAECAEGLLLCIMSIVFYPALCPCLLCAPVTLQWLVIVK